MAQDHMNAHPDGKGGICYQDDCNHGELGLRKEITRITNELEAVKEARDKYKECAEDYRDDVVPGYKEITAIQKTLLQTERGKVADLEDNLYENVNNLVLGHGHLLELAKDDDQFIACAEALWGLILIADQIKDERKALKPEKDTD